MNNRQSRRSNKKSPSKPAAVQVEIAAGKATPETVRALNHELSFRGAAYRYRLDEEGRLVQDPLWDVLL